MLFHRRYAALLAASVLLAAGCGTTARTPVMPVQLANMAIDRQTDRSELGQLQVDLKTTEQSRKVLATVADVTRYRITVSGNGLTTPIVKTCAAPTGSNGKVSALFDELLPGDYTITVEALDADGNVIGSDTQVATVKKGKCTVVNLHIKRRRKLRW